MEESFLAMKQCMSLCSLSTQNIQMCVLIWSQWPFWTKKVPPLETAFQKSVRFNLTFKIVHNISPYLTFVLLFFGVENYTWWFTWLCFHLGFKSVSKLKHICLNVRQCKEMNPNALKWICTFLCNQRKGKLNISWLIPWHTFVIMKMWMSHLCAIHIYHDKYENEYQILFKCNLWFFFIHPSIENVELQ
jgi:hypothetical protein